MKSILKRDHLFVVIAIAFNFSACQHHEKQDHKHYKSVHHDFKDAKAWSKKFDAPDRHDWQKPDEIIRVMNIQSGDRVADIGAGTGYLLPHLNKAVGKKGRVYGLDVERSLVDFMAERIKKEKLVNSEAALIPLDSPGPLMAKSNKVVILNTWHHISNRKDYAKKMFATLPKNAQVFVVDPQIGAGGPGPKDHHRMKPEAIIDELKAGGFNCNLTKEGLKHQFIVSCKK